MKTTIASLFVASLATWVASAAVVITSDAQSNPHGYVVSSTDLINGLSPSAQSGNFGAEDSGGTPVLTNGTFPTTFQFAAYATGGNAAGTSVTYTFASASISSIAVFGGWQDGGRDQQGYSVLTSTDGTNFTLLATVNYDSGLGGGGRATRTIISDTTGTLATNVQAVRFDFNTVENGYTGYSEIDVFAVPEPSAALLGGLGVLGLLIRRRK